MNATTKVTIWQLAAVIGKSVETIRRNVKLGNIPPADSVSIGARTHCWRLSTIADWNPALAARLESLLESNDIHQVF